MARGVSRRRAGEYTLDEAAALLGVTRRTVQTYISETDPLKPRLRSLKRGHRRAITKAAIERFQREWLPGDAPASRESA